MLHVPSADCFNAKTVRHSMTHRNTKNVIILHLKSKHDPTERKKKRKMFNRVKRIQYQFNSML